MYIERDIKKRIDVLKKGFPVVTLTGPRQSGKTTFLRHNFPNHKYFNFEDPVTLNIVKEDPVTFFTQNPENIIVDEVQRFPEFLSFVQVHVDERKKMGSIFLSGSQNLLISEKISQTLAGRSAYQALFPLSMNELQRARLQSLDKFGQMVQGFYPTLYTRDISPMDYFKQYISTYTERDVRQVRNISELSQFQKFMGLLSGRIGQVLNISSLASDTGVSPNTAEDWLSILEASYIIKRLNPYFKNIGKRLIKSPKIYFLDTGLLVALLNVQNEQQLQSHYLVGSIFENFVISEMLKNIENFGIPAKLFFYRDSHGHEVDVIVDFGLEQIPVEIKLSASYNESFSKNLEQWNKVVNKEHEGFVIYGGEKKIETKKTKMLPWNDFNAEVLKIQ